MSDEMQRIEQHVEKLDSRFTGISGKAVAAGAAIGIAATAMVALGKAAFDMGAEFDDAFDSIAIKSGATGEALQQLQMDFEAVVQNVPTSFENAATAIGLLSARTGQTGEDLQKLAEQMLNLSRLTGTDVAENVRNVTRVFGDWGIATDDQSLAMDKLFKAAQMSGSSVSDLSQKIVQFGAPLRQLGIGFDEAVAMMAKFEKEGVNTETVMGTMRIALAKMAEVGLDPQDTFKRLIATIEGMEDPLEATQLAMEVFGKRGGADMAAAIREGRFAIDEYVESLETAGGAIKDAADKTDDAQQEMEKAWNALKVAAQPVVTTVFEAMNAIMVTLTPLIKEFAKDLANIAELFKEIGSGRVTPGEAMAGLLGGKQLPGRTGDPMAGITLPNYSARFPGDGGDAGGAGDDGSGAGGSSSPGTLSAAEIAALRKDTEAQKDLTRAQREAAQDAARARREQEREAARAAKEAERILQEQAKQAEREAEIEARRINTIRELGQRRSDAISEAAEARDLAIERAGERADEQIAEAERQFAKEKMLSDERKRLQDEITRGLDQVRERQSTAGRSTGDDRSIEDRDRRRAREDADLLTRRAQQSAQTAQAEAADLAKINAARFAGDSRAVTAAMLAAQERKKAIKDQSADEVAAIQLRRQREDEDFAISQARRAADLVTAKANAEEIKNATAEFNKPMEEFNQNLLKDNLDEKILGYIRAKEAAIEAANAALANTENRADLQFQQGVDRANQGGMTQTQILNLYNTNNGFQGEDAIEDLVDEVFDQWEGRLAHSGG
jgi:TP901 family phage tail tape measure protein